MPICTVMDDGYISNPRFSRAIFPPRYIFPPNSHNDVRVKSFGRFYNNATRRIPNALGALRHLVEKPRDLNGFRLRQKAPPVVGSGKDDFHNECLSGKSFLCKGHGFDNPHCFNASEIFPFMNAFACFVHLVAMRFTQEPR